VLAALLALAATYFPVLLPVDLSYQSYEPRERHSQARYPLVAARDGDEATLDRSHLVSKKRFILLKPGTGAYEAILARAMFKK
jgi:hypothetical protein